MTNKKMVEAYDKEPKVLKKKVIIIFAVFLILALSSSFINEASVTDGGLNIASNIVKGILTPSFDLFGLGETGIPFLLLETFCIAFLGTLIGAILAIPLSFLASKNIVNVKVTYVTRFIAMCVRTVPAFIYGLMFIRVSGPGAFAGVLTMSLISVGMLTKLFSETIEDLNMGILESMDSMGATSLQKILYGVIPQLKGEFLSTLLYRFDMNLRDATTLGLVGAGGIGAPLIFAMNEFRWSDVGAYLLGLVLLVFLIDFVSTKIRTKLTRGI